MFNIIILPEITYSFIFIIIFSLLFKNCPNISNNSIFNLYFFFFSIKGFLLLLILFCIFGLLSFFPLPFTVCLGVFVLKRLTTISLKPPAIFVIGSGIKVINQSYQVFVIGLIFYIFFVLSLY